MSTASIAERVRAAAESRAPLRIRGAGTWLDAGRPVAARDFLSTADELGIVEYVPGDLTMTARAGSSLDDLDRAARKNGQWLPLAPWGTKEATLGATIATATAGPYAAAFGLPRDVVLGLEFVTGTGDVVRSGGRVVKNVAGFDLTRLLTGSWGTLGVITEATVRLRALPQLSRVIAIRVDDTTATLADATAAIRKLPFAPFACELLNAALARHVGFAASPTLLMELGGNTAAVAAQLDLVRALGAIDDAPDGVLDKLRAADRDVQSTWRVSGKPTQFATLWTEANALPDALVHGSPMRGVIRVLSRSFAPIANSGRVVVEKLAANAWPSLQAPGVDRLAEDVRAKFDPARVLNPGILGAAA
jgi:glycolate oxidase FAD binding subunit